MNDETLLSGVLSRSEGEAVLRDLRARYGEPHRHYHVWAHIEHMLAMSKGFMHRLAEPDAFAIAICFHDAVYDPRAGDNEERSAALMRECLEGKVAPGTLEAAAALIMATKTHRPNGHPDAAWLIDIDLAILAADQAAFDAYDAAVRREFAHVPDEAYRAGRSRVLQGFLDRDRIFLTEEFAGSEPRARHNLRRAIARLA